MLRILAEVGELNPDQRLGQLLTAALQPTEPCPLLATIEDGELALRLQAATQRNRARGFPFDARSYWAYEGGWFATNEWGGWYEVNEETQRLGRPWEFREATRTADYVELRDSSRGVTVRLTATAMLARWDSAGGVPWEEYYKGQWKRRGG